MLYTELTIEGGIRNTLKYIEVISPQHSPSSLPKHIIHMAASILPKSNQLPIGNTPLCVYILLLKLINLRVRMSIVDDVDIEFVSCNALVKMF